MELVGMQRIANPLKQRGMERVEMQRIANPLKLRGMERIEMQRIANPLKQREMELAGIQPIADYPFLHPPGADKHSFHLFPIMPQQLLPQTIA